MTTNFETNSYLPVLIDISDRRVVIVGGGSVAQRKVERMVRHGNTPHVVSPSATPALRELIEKGLVTYDERQFQDEDVAGAFLVIAATSNTEVNARIEKLGREAGALVNRTDDVNSELQIPGTIERGDLQIAISTKGASAHFTRALRTKLEEEFDDAYGTYLAFLHEMRALALNTIEDAKLRRAILTSIPDEELLDRVRAGETLAPAEVLADIERNVRQNR